MDSRYSGRGPSMPVTPARHKSSEPNQAYANLVLEQAILDYKSTQQLTCESETIPLTVPPKSNSKRSGANSIAPSHAMSMQHSPQTQPKNSEGKNNISNQQNVFLDVVDAFQNYIGNKLSIVETEIIQAENDIKSLQTKLNDIASNHQEQEVHIFQTIRRGIAHLQSRQSGLTDEVRTNREIMQRNIKDQIQQRREKIRQLSAVEQFAKRNFSEFKHVQQAATVSHGTATPPTQLQAPTMSSNDTAASTTTLPMSATNEGPPELTNFTPQVPSLGECATLVSSVADIGDFIATATGNSPTQIEKSGENSTDLTNDNVVLENNEISGTEFEIKMAEQNNLAETKPDWIIDVQPLIDFINNVSFLKKPISAPILYIPSLDDQGSLKLSWSPPSIAQSIDLYKLEYSIREKIHLVQLNTNDSQGGNTSDCCSYVIDKATTIIQISFRVSCSNKMGDSEWSDWKTWRSDAKPLSFQFQASTANSKLVVDNDNMWVCFPDGNTGAISEHGDNTVSEHSSAKMSLPSNASKAHPSNMSNAHMSNANTTQSNQAISTNAIRFSPALNVLGNISYRTGRHYWESRVSAYGWAIGVATENISRNVWLGQTSEAWVLHFNTKSGLKARHDGHAIKLSIGNPAGDLINSFKESSSSDLGAGGVGSTGFCNSTKSGVVNHNNAPVEYDIGILLDYDMGFVKFYYIMDYGNRQQVAAANFSNSNSQNFDQFSTVANSAADFQNIQEDKVRNEAQIDYLPLYSYENIAFSDKAISPCFNPCYHGHRLYLNSGLKVPDKLRFA